MDADQRHEDEHHLEGLPEDVLARILGLLSPLQLAWAEHASRRCRSVVVQRELWRQRCLRAHPTVADATSSLPPDTSLVPWHHASLASHKPSDNGSAAAAGSGMQAEGGGGGSTPAGLEVQAVSLRRSAFYKKLLCRLIAPMARESLIAEALAASSTDQSQESIANVLTPTSKTRTIAPCYWSSRGSSDADSSEALAFRLAHPLCVVSELQLRPFRAWFQRGSPLYAPKAVRFRLGGLACFATDGSGPLPNVVLRLAAHAELQQAAFGQQVGPGMPDAAAVLGSAAVVAVEAAGAAGGSGQPASASSSSSRARGQIQQRQPQWVWESPAYKVAAEDVLQCFPILPTLCVGGFLRVELLGRRQRQASDDAFYTCICYLRALGSPVYTFQLRPQWSSCLTPLPTTLLAPAPVPAHAGVEGVAGQQGQQHQQQEQEEKEEEQQQEQRCGWQLVYIPADPLLLSGGLAAVSEGGRLVAGGGGGEEEDFGSESGSEGLDEEMVWGGDDSDDQEMVQEIMMGMGEGAGQQAAALGQLPTPAATGGGASSSSSSDDDSSGSGSSSSSDGDSNGSGSRLGDGVEGLDEAWESDTEWAPGGDAGAY